MSDSHERLTGIKEYQESDAFIVPASITSTLISQNNTDYAKVTTFIDSSRDFYANYYFDNAESIYPRTASVIYILEGIYYSVNPVNKKYTQQEATEEITLSFRDSLSSSLLDLSPSYTGSDHYPFLLGDDTYSPLISPESQNAILEADPHASLVNHGGEEGDFSFAYSYQKSEAESLTTYEYSGMWKDYYLASFSSLITSGEEVEKFSLSTYVGIFELLYPNLSSYTDISEAA